MTRVGESLLEASSPIYLLSTKATTRIGTYNVRTMYEVGKTAQVAKEMERYHIELLGICECRWNGSGMVALKSGQKVIFSGHAEENHDHTEGVALIMSPKAAAALVEWQPISSRIITARFNSKGRKVSVIQCYAPTNNASDESKLAFYDKLQSVFTELPRRDIKILMGDMNAKIGKENLGKEHVMGKEALGNMNENGELFTDFCAFNDLVIGGSIFPHKDIHKTTWISPDGKTKNQIDHITISKKWRSSLLDTRSKRGADVASDHHLVIGVIKIKLRTFKDTADRASAKFNTQRLREARIKQAFSTDMKNRLDALAIEEATPIDQHWEALKDVWLNSCHQILEKRTRTTKEWISSVTWDLVQKRKHIKHQIMVCVDAPQLATLQEEYRKVNKMVKKSARKDKRFFCNSLATEAEQAAAKRDLNTLYKITRTLCMRRSNQDKPVKDTQGNPLSKEVDQRERWLEHFRNLLNRPIPAERLDIPPATPDKMLQVNTNPPTKSEIIKALKELKNGKAAGPDGVPAEALKVDLYTTATMMLPLLRKIWKQGCILQDWKKGHLVKIPKKGDLGLCKNWRGIMLLSVPSKLLTRIILDRLKNAIDDCLRPEQAGFRKNKSCIDQIATLRIIIEQSIEWQSPLFLNFIDFRQAFDSVDRETIWKLLRHYGIPGVFINLIQQLYVGATCQVVHKGKLTEEFEVRTGVRQGCLLSPMIFLLVVDWIMRETTKIGKTGIQWSPTKNLEDLDYADDLCLLAQKHEDMQLKTNTLVRTAAMTGLEINTEKTETVTLQQRLKVPITVRGHVLNDVDTFVYLGSVVSTTGGSDEDAKSRIGKARYAFNKLRPIWQSSSLSVRSKLRIFNSNVKSVLLYSSETWRITKKLLNKLQVFINNCLRFILKITRADKMSNEDLWKQTQQEPIGQQISRRKWRWIGHTLRKPRDDITRQSLQWMPRGKRKTGRPKTTWKRSCEEEMNLCGLTWDVLQESAQDRVQWRLIIEALCSTRNERT